MRKFLCMLLALTLLMSLGVSALAQSGDRYTMYIEGTQKVVYKGNEEAGYTESGRCNTKLYRLLDEPSMDRSDFASMTIDFEDVGEDYYKATRQVVVGNNGFTYESSNPEVAFIEKAGAYHPTGLGEAEIVVYGADGAELDRFTVSVSGAKKAYIVKAICSNCGEDMGASMHILSCGHYVCEGNGAPMNHAAGACGVAGHFVCDGRNHSLCSNCLSHMCYGEHGVGVCQHVHNWFYAHSSNYWPYVEPGCPMRICTSCGARDYAWWLLPKPTCPPTASPTPTPTPAPTTILPPATTPTPSTGT